MFLNDKTVFKCGLFEGLKLAGHHQARAVDLCRFGKAQRVSLVAIAQSLDNILVYDLVPFKESLMLDGRGDASIQHNNITNQESVQSQRDSAVSYISIKDQVIESLAVIEVGSDRMNSSSKDLLLIGCVKSIMIYDTFNQEHLFSVNTSSKITTIAAPPASDDGLVQPATSVAKLLFCGGIQKLYAYQMDCNLAGLSYPNRGAGGTGGDLASSPVVGIELSSERTISETVSCLIRGTFAHLECLIAGFHENRIKLYSVDQLEQSIQTCRLTLNESAKIQCLCAIETIQQPETNQHRSTTAANASGETDLSQQQSQALPSLSGSSTKKLAHQQRQRRAQMNYFAYGLENCIIGVYRLLAASKETNAADISTDDDRDKPQQQQQHVSLFAERLWRHKSKQVPMSLCLFDIDGDGRDELIVGYRNGRLEVRAPFTGQLLTSTRCFRSSGQLVGLLKWTLGSNQMANIEPLQLASEDTTPPNRNEQTDKPMVAPKQDILIACSSISSLVAFKPKHRQPRRPLIDHLAQSMRNHHHMIVPDPSNRHDELQLNYDEFMSTIQVDHTDKSKLEPLEEEEGDSQHPLAHNDEDADQQQSWPIACESKQNSELLQEIGLKKKQQVELSQRLRQIQHELMRKQVANSQAAMELMTASGVAAEQSGPIQVAHCWNFDGTNDKLLLTIVLDSLVGLPVSVEMVELVEHGDRLLPHGHVIINPVRVTQGPVPSVLVELVLGGPASRRRSKDDGRMDAEQVKLVDEMLELRLAVFLGGDETGPGGLEKSSTQIRNVHERTVVLPKFFMFVPESLVHSAAPRSDRPLVHQRAPMIRKTFVLPERANRLQILDWMSANFLCFQFGQMIDHESHQAELHNEQHELWTSVQDNRLEAMRLDASMMLSVRQFSANSTSSTATRGTTETATRDDEDEEDFCFELVDLRTLGNSHTPRRHIRLGFEAKQRRLAIESNDSDLLVDLIQMLALDRLQLSIKLHAIADEKKESNEGVSMLLKELATINENSQQLEESERRIQTEIYESAELIKSLMQQMSISNELHEFGISKQLLAEIAMMLDGTQNSAQAFYLNNRSRLNLMKQANCLREKVLFLTGDEDHPISQ